LRQGDSAQLQQQHAVSYNSSSVAIAWVVTAVVARHTICSINIHVEPG
jgi:hypothetical protein